MNSTSNFTIPLKLKRISAIFLVLFATHFFIKWTQLSSYTIRDGQVIGLEAREMIEKQYSRGKSLNYPVLRVTPTIAYYSEGDTLMYGEGTRTLLSYLTLNDSAFYTTGEKIKILELKTNPDKVVLFTLFHYWIYTYELITICLIAFVVFGFSQVYIKKS